MKVPHVGDFRVHYIHAHRDSYTWYKNWEDARGVAFWGEPEEAKRG